MMEINRMKNILVLSKGPLRRMKRLAMKISVRMDAKTITLTCQVDPSNKNISVMLLVSNNKNLAPNRNKVQSDSFRFFLSAAKMISNIEIESMISPALK
jgi:hypothetical protein